MKRTICIAVLIALGLCGCAASPAFLRGVEAQWQPIKSDYVEYVGADANLTADGKRIRLESVKTMDELITAEKARNSQ